MLGDAIAQVIGKIIDRAWPDETKRAEAAIALEEMRQRGEFRIIDAELQAAQMQADTNKVEAASSDPFTSRWRPFIGWICGLALVWHYIGRPMATWVVFMTGGTTPIPEVELGDLFVVLLGMLGLGGMRTAEKIKGVAN